jgi:Flp pilus assembly pilin Flp
MIARVRPIRGMLGRMRREEGGATLVEFAIVAPVFFLLLLGTFDFMHQQYTASLMYGVMQKAGRDLTLESAGSRQAAIDNSVIERVRNVVPPGADVRLVKLSHNDFADIGEPEEILGGDNDELCEGENNEDYIDANNNGRFDLDRGAEGIGGARDAVLYTVIVTYPRMFAMSGLMPALPKNVQLEASTVLRNQPFDEQDRNTPPPKDCPYS